MRTRIHNTYGTRTMVQVTLGDITEQDTHAIVNAANDGLWAGGGICGAIATKGGLSIFDECKRKYPADRNGLRIHPGNAAITSAGKLKAKNVIHAVGPMYRSQNMSQSAALLGSTYTSALALAQEAGLKSISFPSISTGIFGYPLHEAAAVAMTAVVEWLSTENHDIKDVRFVMWDGENYRAYRDMLYAIRKEATHRRKTGWLSDAEIDNLSPKKAFNVGRQSLPPDFDRQRTFPSPTGGKVAETKTLSKPKGWNWWND